MHAFENGHEVELKPDIPPSCEPLDYEELKFINDHIKPYEDIIIGFAVALRERHKLDDEISLLNARLPHITIFVNSAYLAEERNISMMSGESLFGICQMVLHISPPQLTV